MIDLIQCPFCGEEPTICKCETPRLYRQIMNHPYYIACYNCNLVFGYDEDYGGIFDTEEEAIESWNTRVVGE